MAVVLPIFPLNTVLFPGMSVPLHVFEPRYRSLVEELTEPVAAEDEPERSPQRQRRFGAVWIELGHEVAAEPGSDEESATDTGIPAIGEPGTTLPRVSSTGCTALLRDVRSYEDGRYDLLIEGGARFAITDLGSVDASSPEEYAIASVSFLAEHRGSNVDEHAERVRELYETYCDRLSSIGMAPDISRDLPKDPIALSYTVASTIVLDQAEKQRLLVAEDAATRLALAARFLRRENRIVAAPTLYNLPAGPFLDRGVSFN